MLLIGFFLFIICLLISVELFIGLAFVLIPTTIVFFILAVVGIHIAFWQLYLVVFLAIFVINLL